MRIKSFRDYLISEAAMSALLERAENTGVSVEVLYEVFDRGVVAWDEDTQKTVEQYAFNRVDSFIAGGYAAKLDEDLLNEVSKTTLSNYIRKAKLVRDNMPRDSKEYKKSKTGIERAERLYNIKEDKVRHPEHKRAYVEPYEGKGVKGLKASNRHGKLKFFNNSEHGRKAAYRHAGLKEEVEQIDELTAAAKNNYVSKATKSVEDMNKGEYSTDKDNKAFRRKMYIMYAKATQKEDTNVVDNSGTELIERKVLARDDPAQYFSVKKRETKSAKVRQKYNERNKPMYDRHKTETVLRQGFMKRSNKDNHLVDKKGHQLTDRIRDQNRDRLTLLRKSRTVQEGAEYIEARRTLHDAHHESARLHAGMERDPELRRQDLHRAKRHKHASRVLEIIQAKRKKK